MTTYTALQVERRAATMLVTLSRPEAANGMNPVMTRELAAVAQACDADPGIKAVILTAAGRFFCAGGDLKAMAGSGDHVATEVKQLADDLHRAISTFSRMSAPLIVAVNGVAAGAGFSLAMTGDLVIAGQSANFTLGYTSVGLSPDGSSSYFLPRLIGLRKTQELMFTNRTLTACEAFDWGLITTVVPDGRVMEEALRLAEMFGQGAPGSNAGIKKLLLATFGNGLETQMEIEGRLIAECAGSRNGQEGIGAF